MSTHRDNDHGRTTATSALGSANRFFQARFAWMSVAVLLAVAGTLGALMAARAQSRQAASKAQQTLASTSVGIASILKLSILHESDLVISAESFVGANPRTTNAQFRHWADSERARQRYPELFGIAYTQVVPSTGLTAFARAAVRDPSGPLAAGGTFSVIPPGHRPFYCLQRASWYRGGASAFAYPAGYDFCSDRPVAATLFASRDSGIDSYVPIQVGRQKELGVQAAVYRGGLTPPTTRERRATFIGAIGLAVLPQALLGQALAGHPNLGVTFTFRGSGADVSFVGGHAPIHGQTAVTSLHDGWILRTVGPRVEAGVLQQPISRAVLLGGTVLSLLIAALLAVLGTGRSRAARLIDLRTGELRHLALHDALTGLANRALINDRLDALLVRSHRDGVASAVLFIDLDGFKQVNDTLGHQVGDQLLRSVAERLSTRLPSIDTVGRLGGDEFIVLVDGASVVSPALTAQRVLKIIGTPFELDGAAAPVTISASVGIACGHFSSREDLLRSADLALYQAKAGGRNRYDVFEPGMATAMDLSADPRASLNLV